MSDRKIVSRILRRHFDAFARKAIRHLNGRHIPLDNLYLEVLFAYLLAVADGEVLRLIVNMPPRHLKTMAGIALAGWMMAHDPSKKIMVVCYGEDLAKRIAQHIRNLIKSDWYRKEFPATRIGETDTGTLVTTTAGGYVLATSFAGAITGQGADLIIVDDPHKISDAAYPDQIARNVEIFNSTVESRLDSPSKGQILVLAHRIARYDLSGTLLDQGGWSHLRLPLIADEDLEFDLDGLEVTLPKNSILREDEFTSKSIQILRTKTKTPNFETLYEQNPSELDDPLLPEHFRRFRAPPPNRGTLLSVDWAYTPNTSSSYSVIQAWRSLEGNFYLIDQWRARVTLEELAARLLKSAQKYSSGIVLIESGGVGEALALALRKLGRSAPRVELISSGGRSKYDRFREVIPLIKEGRVLLPLSAEWTNEYVEEHTAFPDVKNTDQVDTTSQTLSWFASGNCIPPPSPRCLAVGPNGQTVWSSPGKA